MEFHITKERFEELKAELEQEKKEGRNDIAERLKRAKEFGDLSENAEYHQAREEQGRNEDRINQIESILKNSVIVKKHSSSIVEVGTTVVVQKEKGGETVYHMVGQEEADLSLNKISNKSPLGQALFGKKKGDVFSIETPKGLVKYTLIDIQ